MCAALANKKLLLPNIRKAIKWPIARNEFVAALLQYLHTRLLSILAILPINKAIFDPILAKTRMGQNYHCFPKYFLKQIKKVWQRCHKSSYGKTCLQALYLKNYSEIFWGEKTKRQKRVPFLFWGAIKNSRYIGTLLAILWQFICRVLATPGVLLRH